MYTEKLCSIVNICTVIVFLLNPATSRRVTNVFPNVGSFNGETRVTIEGTGFADNQFNFGAGNEHLGNKVDLVSATRSLEGRIHLDGCHETQITFYTPKHMKDEDYFIRVTVDGIPISFNEHCSGDTNKCKFRPSNSYTPTLTNVEPRSGPPDSKLTIHGRIFTDRYGSNMPTDQITNGVAETFLRSYFGGQNCELRDEVADDLYGITLNNGGNSYDGNFQCLMEGTHIGNLNGSYIISGQYGRSLPKSDMFRVSSEGDIYMFQSFAEVTDVSPETGSTEGGLRLSIKGRNLGDQTNAPVKVFVGGIPCKVESVSDPEIICITSEEPMSSPLKYEGNRGWMLETWNATSKAFNEIDDVLSLSTNASDYMVHPVDEMRFTEDSMNNYVTRMHGYFVAPESGLWEFYIKGDDRGKLFFSQTDNPADKVEATSFSSRKTSYIQKSSKFNLTKGNKYYMAVIHGESSGESTVSVAAKHYNTKLTNGETGNAQQEKHKLSFSSTVRKEIQVMSFSSFTSKSSVYEKQTVTVTGPSGTDLSQAKFRLKMYSASTVELTALSTEEEVAAAIGNLPGYYGSATVVSTPITDGATFTVEFISEIGDLPLLQGVSDHLTVSVAETVQGQPSLTKFALQMAGNPSPPIDVGATVNEMEEAIAALFSVKCIGALLMESSETAYVEDYEQSESSRYGQRVTDMEPFCGRHSSKNPRYIIFHSPTEVGIRVTEFKEFCFAHKGPMRYVRVDYRFNDADGALQSKFTWFRITESEEIKWIYQCMDLKDLLSGRNSGGSGFYVTNITYARSEPGDVYIDTVMFARNKPLTDLENILMYREVPRNLEGFLMNDVTVTEISTNQYNITLDPHFCGHNYPLFELFGGKVSTGDVSPGSNIAALTYKSGGGSASMTVTRNLAASPPIKGTLSITFDGNTLAGVPISGIGEVKEYIQTMPGMNHVKVTKEGTCSVFSWEIEWPTTPGDLPEITFDDSAVTGENVIVTIATLMDGHLLYDPIPGDMMRTMHDGPQVTVFVNKIPTKCVNDCSFTWNETSTPTVTGISPNQGSQALNTQVTISGTGFSTNTSWNIVTIGGVKCDIVSAMEQSLVCDIGIGPLGLQNVSVNVEDKGFAKHPNGRVQFSYTLGLNSSTPNTGSLGGGTRLTLTGYGFADGVSVAVGGVNCEIESVNPSQIICVTGALAQTTQTTVNIELSQESETETLSNAFTYIVGAIVTSLTQSSTSLTGFNVTISGTGFGASKTSIDPIKIGDKAVTVISYSDTEIVIDAPAQAPGAYSLKLPVGNEGYADVLQNSIPKVTYQLSVQNVYPKKGSMYGGTKVTITGTGFLSDKSLYEIKFGNTNCDILSITSTVIKCQIADAATVHVVKNDGIHPVHGELYEWNPKHTHAVVGDIVRFQWGIPHWLNDIGYVVQQTESQTANSSMDGGFSSGTVKTPNGAYEYRFVEAGTYHYWSGYVDKDGIIKMRGMVHVQDKSSSVAKLMFKMANFQAEYDVNSGVSDPSYSGSCNPTYSKMAGCSHTEPSAPDTDYFYFIFYSCLSPKVTAISLQNGTSFDEIEMTGIGFSSTKCHNEISVGDAGVNVLTSSSSSITFNIDVSTEPPIGVYKNLNVRVSNLGYALLGDRDEENKFGLFPGIQSLSPNAGSLEGGTKLKILGSGFQGTLSDITVNIGIYTCDIVSFSYTEITCLTPSNVISMQDVKVLIQSNGQTIPAVCKDSTNECQFSYQSNLTPQLTSVAPSTVSGPQNFTLNGNSFGSVAANVQVKIGGASCNITTVSNTAIECSVVNIPAGVHTPQVNVHPYGLASTTETVTSQGVITSVLPNNGSIHGGTKLIIMGHGFSEGNTAVTIDGTSCLDVSVQDSTLTCTTQAHADGATNLIVTANSVAFSSETFTYDSASTPTVTSTTPTKGVAGDSIRVHGSGFSTNTVDNEVKIGGVLCSPITAASENELQCTLGVEQTGDHEVIVYVENKGLSDNSTVFEYELSVSGISPASGSTGGDQKVTISGSGFDGTTSVTICGTDCPSLTDESTASGFVCLTPAASAQTCTVIVETGGLTKSLSNAYTYDAAKTPVISSVSPERGGTAGGTNVTITGSGYGTDPAVVNVTIAGVICDVQTVSNTEITCITGSRKPSIKTKVRVEISGNGIASQENADFYYIDVWSSTFTWGGGPLPSEGELVVVPEGQILLLDTDTPILKMLLIKGGKLIFDEKDVELKAENILISHGGALEIGTEGNPFQHKAIITMYGNYRSPELPIFGAKTLAVREGVLDMHGIPVITWTRLDTTATAGSQTITTEIETGWKTGDKIVIATTGARLSQRESEVHIISSISGKDITLEKTLVYEHLGITLTFAGQSVDFRAEVGLLTRNIVFRGHSNPQWNDKIEACPKGFDPGEFTTQTCFQGRFGEEMGSDQFGGAIMLHGERKDENLVKGRIEYVEVTHAGQAFRLGRYPIHFHINGDMSLSYVRGCGIYNTFNRAVNIHGSHNTLVEWNVIYNIMGGAFFLEDGIERGNTFQYNLAVFVRSSTSLRNDDITPAAFWVTHPNNTIRHNAAAGGSHFGYWYRMLDHPEGPSFTRSVCPRNGPLGEFSNNTAHSLGWFGLWIFESYFPRQGDGCGNTDLLTVVFQSLTAWNCEKGAEAVNSGAIQFNDFVLVNNKLAGFEGKLIIESPQTTSDAFGITNSLIVGHASPLYSQCTAGGIIFPHGFGMVVDGVKFVNFDREGCATFRFAKIDGTCTTLCGGFYYKAQNIQFTNVDKKTVFNWLNEGVIEDMDGSVTGITGGRIIPSNPNLPPAKCQPAADDFNLNFNASVCSSDVGFHRFSFNKIHPTSLMGKSLQMTNKYGSSQTPYAFKRITHKEGWMTVLVDGEDYTMEFVNGEHLTNISYNGIYYMFNSGDWLSIKTRVDKKPDRLTIDGGQTYINESETGLDSGVSYNADWYYNSSDTTVAFAVSATHRSKRASLALNNIDRPYNLKIFKCFYAGCVPPTNPNDVPPVDTRPPGAIFWSDVESWSDAPDGWGGNYGNGSYGLPRDGDDVQIQLYTWMVVDKDVTLPVMRKLVVYGVLEFDNSADSNFVLEATYIYIRGGRIIIGWPENPFQGSFLIKLDGNHDTPVYPADSGPTVGSKVIGVFGGLDLHGKHVETPWTSLSTTAAAGSNTIDLKVPVSWVDGNEIMITTTSYSAWHTETFRITGISADNRTLTLNSSLAHRHLGYSEVLSSNYNLNMAAKVALLTRNIKIIGKEYPEMEKQSFGARILVGTTTDITASYIGYTRISNVEFFHAGQEGWNEAYDPRYALAFVDTGEVSEKKPSYVKNNVFHNGFSTAIGVYGTNGLLIEGNTIHHTVGPNIVIDASDATLRRNLMVLCIWPGTYLNREDLATPSYDAALEAIKAKNLIFQENVVAGSERVAFHVPGEACNSQTSYGNEAHSSLIGVAIYINDLADGVTPIGCRKYSGYFIWKCSDFGIYYNFVDSPEISDNILAENQVNVFPMIVGPSSVAHIVGQKQAIVKDNVIVGVTDSFDCTVDKLDMTDKNIASSSKGRSWSTQGGMTGMILPTFTAGGNNAFKKPFKGIMAYNSIAGVLHLQNVTFAHFKTSCGNREDFALTTHPSNDDGQHPMKMSNIVLSDVAEKNKFFIHRPNVGKINPADCVDMDCDGLKKALFKDEDGSLLGSPGAVISQSEFEWNGDQRRGLGDYRIPKVMLTDLNGNRLAVGNVAPMKGIIRDEDSCNYTAAWQAYKCHNLDYEMLIIESLDADTETRRLSPVAILGDKYVDLINGPQDHGWCSGYTCQKRLSTFMAIVATGKEYEIYFTSTSPQHLRLHLLNSDNTQAIRVGIYYGQPNRIDVKVDNTEILPTNGEILPNGKYYLHPPTTDHWPNVTSDPRGTNFFDRTRKLQHVIVKGPTPVDLKMAETVMVSFSMPELTVDEFFGENIVQNLAAFLGVPPSMVRIMEVVNEQTGNRRKRSTGLTVIIIEIGGVPGASNLSRAELTEIHTKIINEVQVGNISLVMNMTIYGTALTELLPLPTDAAWADVKDEGDLFIAYQQVGSMNYLSALSASYEGAQFTIPPRIRVYDEQGLPITKLGSPSQPWVMEVSIVPGTGHASGTLLGTTNVTFANGWANFTDLAISHPGSDYQLMFQVIQPVNATNFTLITDPLNIPKRPVAVGLVSSPVRIMMNSAVSFEIELIDGSTGEKIENIAWRGHTWSVTLTHMNPELALGSVSGITDGIFNPSTGRKIYSNLAFSDGGHYAMKFNVTSSPPEYNFEYDMSLFVIKDIFSGMNMDTNKVFELIIDASYDDIVGGDESRFITMITNYFTSIFNVFIQTLSIARGSIIVTMTIEGNTTVVQSAIDSVCGSIESSTSLNVSGQSLVLKNYLQVDGQKYYGVNCGVKKNDGLSAGIIAAIVIGSLAILSVIIALLVWRFVIYPKTKTSDTNRRNTLGNLNQDGQIEKYLFNERSFNSLREKSMTPFANNVAPMTTATDIRGAPNLLVPDNKQLQLTGSHSDLSSRSSSRSSSIPAVDVPNRKLLNWNA